MQTTGAKRLIATLESESFRCWDFVWWGARSDFSVFNLLSWSRSTGAGISFQLAAIGTFAAQRSMHGRWQVTSEIGSSSGNPSSFLVDVALLMLQSSQDMQHLKIPGRFGLSFPST